MGRSAGEKLRELDQSAEGPIPSAVSARHDAEEQLLGPGAIQEVLLLRRALVGVYGRDGDAIQSQRFHVVEEEGDFGRIGVVEERAVDADAEALRLDQPDTLARLVVCALLAD